MSKCHVDELMRIYTCLFEDIKDAYPTLAGELGKDLIRLRSFVAHRGLHALCVDLPAAGKHLDRCLSDGAYKLSGLPITHRYSGRVVIPKFLRGLYLRVFNETGSLKEDYDVESVFFLRQVLYLAKRVQVPCSRKVVLETVQDFFAVDSDLPEPEGFWADPTPEAQDVIEAYEGFPSSPLYIERRLAIADPQMREAMSTLLTTLDAVSRIVTCTLGSYDPKDFKYRHGPGAISEPIGPSNKYYWRNWSDRLENVFPIADCGFHSYCAWGDRVIKEDVGSLEPSSRLIAVPKSLSSPRLIAAEPGEHMWCQQNLRHYIASRTEETWLATFVCFNSQTPNQDLCRVASEDGRLATVDLSSASDRVTCHLVGQFFRVNPRLVLSLQSTRTRFVCQTLDASLPFRHELRKFSTMGSACTFPIQTLVFLGLALSTVLVKRQLKPNLRNIRSLAGEVAVFGDDIILPSDCRDLFTQALEMFHFKINSSKTFWTGRFRESCGVDAFGGVSLTPAYWRTLCTREPETIASTIDVRNNFHSRFLLRTADRIASTIPVGSIPLVSMASGACGFKTYNPPRFNHRLRWNRDLCRLELRVRVFLTRTTRVPVTDDSALLQYFTEDPSPQLKWSTGYSLRPKHKHMLRYVGWDELIHSS